MLRTYFHENKTYHPRKRFQVDIHKDREVPVFLREGAKSWMFHDGHAIVQKEQYEIYAYCVLNKRYFYLDERKSKEGAYNFIKKLLENSVEPFLQRLNANENGILAFLVYQWEDKSPYDLVAALRMEAESADVRAENEEVEDEYPVRLRRIAREIEKHCCLT